MRQLLLRVPDELHRRLSARAQREGRSVNAVAGEILDATVDVDTGSRRDRVRAAAAANGTLSSVGAEPVGAAERARILGSTRGLGPLADAAVDHERDPR